MIKQILRTFFMPLDLLLLFILEKCQSKILSLTFSPFVKTHLAKISSEKPLQALLFHK